MAVSLANFGLKVDYVTRLPKNDIAESCLMELRRYNVGTDKIVFGGDRLGSIFWKTEQLHGPARLYTTVQILQLPKLNPE